MSSKKNVTFEMRNIEDLVPYARNARTHSPSQISKLAGSIKEFGFLNPIIISEDGGILAGHGRVMAAEKLGLKEVPCITESHLTEAQKKAYILADNRLALDAGWDEELLKIELQELKDLDFDIDMIGFSEDEISEYLSDLQSDQDLIEDCSAPEEEQVIDENVPVITRLGDIWLLGDHRLICGDSTDPETIKRLFDGDNPNLMVTDPPYGVQYDANKNKTTRLDRRGAVLNDDRADWEDAYRLFKGNVAYVWHASSTSDIFITNLKNCGFEITSQIIWNKSNTSFGFSNYKWKHEPCIYATRGNHNWQGDLTQTTVWDIQNISTLKDEGSWGHGTQKPIECMARPIRNNSTVGEYVYDPFCGSGTTIIAAERTKRKCLAVELSQKYCDAIVRRWQSETGRKAVRKQDGLEFDLLVEQAEQACDGIAEEACVDAGAENAVEGA